MIDPWDALLPGRNVTSSRQDEWYQEIDKRYYCSLSATKRIFQPAPEGAVFLLHSGQCQASLRAGRLGVLPFVMLVRKQLLRHLPRDPASGHPCG